MATIYSSAEGQNLYGTAYDDFIAVNHRDNGVYGDDGNDIIVANTNRNDLYGGNGNDYIIAHGEHNNLGYYDYTAGDDTLASDNEDNHLYDTLGRNLFIVGGDDNTAVGGAYEDTFWVYSHETDGVKVTLTGGEGRDNFVFSTGLPGVSAESVGSAAYYPYSRESIVAVITDFDNNDTLYIRDFGMTVIGHTVTADGTWLVDDTGRVNILLANRYDWNAVKNAVLTCDDVQGNTGTLTLDQATNLTLTRIPAGVYVQGDYLNISADFTGNLLMSGAVNYVNKNIITMDARSNAHSGMFIAGNENSNAIYAGTTGNFLWGGSGFTTTDYLYGGAGADIFLTGKNDGTDLIFNADANDTISLYDTNLSDIVSFNVNANSMAMTFNTGNVTAVASSEVLSPKFQLADGSAWRFDRATYSWQSA